MQKEFEAIVVGLGPAGMAAATALAEKKVHTAVVHDQKLPGGQVYRQMPIQFSWLTDDQYNHRPHKVRNLFSQLYRVANRLTFFNEATVYGGFKKNQISICQAGRVLDLAFKKLIICEGASERVIPFPGWTKPGIMTCGGLQRYIKQQGLVPGKRILLSGTGPLLLSVAADLVSAGVEKVTICEAAGLSSHIQFLPLLIGNRPVLTEAMRTLMSLLSRKINILQPYGIVRAYGNGRVQRALINRLDNNGCPILGTEKQLDVNIVAINHGFSPLARLSRLLGCRHDYLTKRGYWEPITNVHQITSKKDIYAAGDCAGIGGAEMAMIEGKIAGLHVAVTLDKAGEECQNHNLKTLYKRAQQLQRYTDRLYDPFPIRPGLLNTVESDTIICRCESVPAGRIWDAIESGDHDLTALKPTRFAMGPCQGRTCEAIVAMMLQRRNLLSAGQGQLSLRPPLTPVPVTAFKEM